MPASAGTGQFLDSDNYEIIEVSNAPAHTTFLLRASGDSMEPKIHDGDILYIKQQPTVEDEEIGVFFLDGNVYVKKQDSKDGVYKLISLNPAYEPIEIDSDNCRCYGKVLNK
jgi:SOS-response transcriptional repressor LexA